MSRFLRKKTGQNRLHTATFSPTPPHCDSTIGHPSTLKLWCEMLETVPPQWLWEPSPMALGTLPNGFGNPPQRLWGTFPTALGTIPNGFGGASSQATEDCSTTTEKHKNNYRNTLFQPIIQNKYVTLQILLHIITSP